jgi:biopolymer transport protein ExbD
VDAFSILVIFLIMNHSTSQITVDLGKKIVLPSARESQFIQDGTIVRIEGNQFFVGEKTFGMQDLVKTLKDTYISLNDEQKASGVVIVADQSLDYADLSPVILAGSQAGFTKFKFAVIRQE